MKSQTIVTMFVVHECYSEIEEHFYLLEGWICEVYRKSLRSKLHLFSVVNGVLWQWKELWYAMFFLILLSFHRCYVPHGIMEEAFVPFLSASVNSLSPMPEEGGITGLHATAGLRSHWEHEDVVELRRHSLFGKDGTMGDLPCMWVGSTDAWSSAVGWVMRKLRACGSKLRVEWYGWLCECLLQISIAAERKLVKKQQSQSFLWEAWQRTWGRILAKESKQCSLCSLLFHGALSRNLSRIHSNFGPGWQDKFYRVRNLPTVGTESDPHCWYFRWYLIIFSSVFVWILRRKSDWCWSWRVFIPMASKTKRAISTLIAFCTKNVFHLSA